MNAVTDGEQITRGRRINGLTTPPRTKRIPSLQTPARQRPPVTLVHAGPDRPYRTRHHLCQIVVQKTHRLLMRFSF